MTPFVFQIDTKSLYLGINNDNEKGHTATVSTNLKQQGTIKPELELFKNSQSNIDFSHLPGLVDECLKNSKAECRITNILVFDQILVNGGKVDCNSEFRLFLKEEIDPNKYQCGRIKLHYPIGLTYEEGRLSISNRKVLFAIKDFLFGYAFIVRAFELREKGVINVIASIVGQDGIAYSKVFLNYKGDTAKKFTDVFNEQADTYDYEILTMKQHQIPGFDFIGPDNYADALKFEKQLAKETCYRCLLELYPSAEIYRLSDIYPYSLYDFEIRSDDDIRFVIVAFTSTDISYFYLSDLKAGFISNYPNKAKVFLVKNVLSESKTIETYSLEDMESIKRRVAMIKYQKY